MSLHNSYRTNIVIVFSISLFLFSNVVGADYEFELNCPYWYIWFNRAGYADITYWHPSLRHDVLSAHEMMMFGCGFNPPGMGKSSAVMLSLPSIQLAPKSAVPLEMTAEEEQKLLEELVDWLDKLWESGALDGYMTEDEYLEFRKALLD